MTPIEVVFLCLVIGLALVSIGVSRAILWLAVIAASYFISGIYWRTGAGGGELVAGLSDAAIIGLLVIFAAYRWEMWVALIYLVSLAVNITFLISNLVGGGVIPHEAYAITLEALNAIALFTIGGVAAFQRKGRTRGSAFRPWLSVFGFARPMARARR